MCDFYGSNLWDLFHGAENIYTEWNKCIRTVFRLPIASHRNLIEPLSEVYHLKTMLISRFTKFYNTLLSINKPAIQNLFVCQVNDVRSEFGSNVQNILSKCTNDDIDNFNKHDFLYCQTDDDDMWRINFIKELLSIKYKQLHLDFNDVDILRMILLLTCN